MKFLRFQAQRFFPFRFVANDGHLHLTSFARALATPHFPPAPKLKEFL